MASSTPSTPEQASTRRMAMNRSFTVPSKLAATTRTTPTPEIGAAEGIETLYVHPSANIVKFSTSGPASRPSSSSGSPRPSHDGSGTLPWASPTERTLASGPLEIYRVPGSVSFLHSGALLHAILPRSQCWCVDGVSKFALRVLPDTYYRIELPGETTEDLEQAEALKVILKKVLFYERTPCPFARTFTVDVPLSEPQQLEVKKSRRRSTGPAKKWRLEKALSWKPDGWEQPREASEEESGASEESEHNTDPEEHRDKIAMQPSKVPRALATMRSSTAPPQLLSTPPPPPPPSSRLRTRFDADSLGSIAPERDISSRGSTAGRTLQSILTDMPPSPPDSSAGMELRDIEDALAGAVNTDLSNPLPVLPESASLETPSAPNLLKTDLPREAEPAKPMREPADIAKSPEATRRPLVERPSAKSGTNQLSRAPSNDDPFAAIQARILARRSIGGTTSFHPSVRSPTRESTSSTSSTATISSSSTSSTVTIGSSHSHSQPTARYQQQNVAKALVTKACAVFLGPPAHLVAVMLRIAARFANGTFGSVFLVESPAGAARRVPGSFNLEDEDDEELQELDELDEWEEDDFGVPLRSPIRLVAKAGLRGKERRGWELE